MIEELLYRQRRADLDDIIWRRRFRNTLDQLDEPLHKLGGDSSLGSRRPRADCDVPDVDPQHARVARPNHERRLT